MPCDFTYMNSSTVDLKEAEERMLVWIGEEFPESGETRIREGWGRVINENQGVLAWHPTASEYRCQQCSVPL